MSIQGFRGNCDSKGKLGMCPSLAEPDLSGFSKSSVCNYEPQANKNNTLRKTICVRFGRIASLSAFVLFADGYVVRITYESFLDYSL